MESKQKESASDSKQEDPPVEEVVVTLEHSSFGRYVFRCEESKLSSSVGAAVAKARVEFDKRKKVAEIDAAQDALKPQMERVKARIAAAGTLGHVSAKASEEAALEKLQAQSDELAKARAKVLG